ncbi:MAG: L7Ae/L30e/S12e/Gadd45 family ribosomal protein [Longibaculum sp.]
MLSKDVLSLLGLASRARKITCGDILLKDIRARKVDLVMIAEDASANTQKKYTDKCAYYQIDCLIVGQIDEISKAIGKENRVAVGIKDRGFANKIKSKLGG